MQRTVATQYEPVSKHNNGIRSVWCVSSIPTRLTFLLCYLSSSIKGKLAQTRPWQCQITWMKLYLEFCICFFGHSAIIEWTNFIWWYDFFKSILFLTSLLSNRVKEPINQQFLGPVDTSHWTDSTFENV